MTRFFLPLILILFISWLVVGLQQEKEKLWKDVLPESESDIKVLFYDTWYDSLLQLPAYENYVKVSKAGIRFLLPDDFTERTDLTDEFDAIYQFYSFDRSLFGIVYSDPIVNDSLAYNFSKETYCSSTLASYRKTRNLTMYDSTLVDVFPAFSGIKVQFLAEEITDKKDKDPFVFSFISTQNNKNLYMLYLYGRPENFEKNKSDIENIFRSVALLNE